MFINVSGYGKQGATDAAILGGLAIGGSLLLQEQRQAALQRNGYYGNPGYGNPHRSQMPPPPLSPQAASDRISELATVLQRMHDLPPDHAYDPQRRQLQDQEHRLLYGNGRNERGILVNGFVNVNGNVNFAGPDGSPHTLAAGKYQVNELEAAIGAQLGFAAKATPQQGQPGQTPPGATQPAATRSLGDAPPAPPSANPGGANPPVAPAPDAGTAPPPPVPGSHPLQFATYEYFQAKTQLTLAEETFAKAHPEQANAMTQYIYQVSIGNTPEIPDALKGADMKALQDAAAQVKSSHDALLTTAKAAGIDTSHTDIAVNIDNYMSANPGKQVDPNDIEIVGPDSPDYEKLKASGQLKLGGYLQQHPANAPAAGAGQAAPGAGGAVVADTNIAHVQAAQIALEKLGLRTGGKNDKNFHGTNEAATSPALTGKMDGKNGVQTHASLVAFAQVANSIDPNLKLPTTGDLTPEIIAAMGNADLMQKMQGKQAELKQAEEAALKNPHGAAAPAPAPTVPQAPDRQGAEPRTQGQPTPDRGGHTPPNPSAHPAQDQPMATPASDPQRAGPATAPTALTPPKVEFPNGTQFSREQALRIVHDMVAGTDQPYTVNLKVDGQDKRITMDKEPMSAQQIAAMAPLMTAIIDEAKVATVRGLTYAPETIKGALKAAYEAHGRGGDTPAQAVMNAVNNINPGYLAQPQEMQSIEVGGQQATPASTAPQATPAYAAALSNYQATGIALVKAIAQDFPNNPKAIEEVAHYYRDEFGSPNIPAPKELASLDPAAKAQLYKLAQQHEAATRLATEDADQFGLQNASQEIIAQANQQFRDVGHTIDTARDQAVESASKILVAGINPKVQKLLSAMKFAHTPDTHDQNNPFASASAEVEYIEHVQRQMQSYDETVVVDGQLNKGQELKDLAAYAADSRHFAPDRQQAVIQADQAMVEEMHIPSPGNLPPKPVTPGQGQGPGSR